MAEIKVKCPYCGSEEISLYGKNAKGKQRYLCKNTQCSHKTFILDYSYNACKPGVKEQAFNMIMNGSGTRDTGRVLKISPNTVTGVIKKNANYPKKVNEEFLNKNKNTAINVTICNAIAVEMDEMWSYYHDKSHQIWLWWAVEHSTNTPIAYTFGTREHKYLDELLSLLKPFDINAVYTDYNYAYRDKISDNILVCGKENTENIERDHLTLRTRIKRLARKTICFSKVKHIHEIVIGSFINMFFFNRPLPSFN